MPLVLKDQATLCADNAWVDRVYASACDVSQSVIVTGHTTSSITDQNYRSLAANIVKDKATYAPAFARLVASGFGGAVSAVATPAGDTGTDAQIKTQVTAAFEALVTK